MPGEGGIWGVPGAWCSTHWECLSPKSQTDQLNKIDQGEHSSSCHGYQSWWTTFSEGYCRGKFFCSKLQIYRYSPELMFSVLSHPAAQSPWTAHTNSHRCLHLHPSKPSSLVLTSWGRQTFMLLDFTQIPACRKELEVELSKFSCWSWSPGWLQLSSAGKAGLGPASCSQRTSTRKGWCCHQPIGHKSSTSWTLHSSTIFIPFMFLNLFRNPSVRG